MSKLEIYFEEDSELTEYEATNKGYRHDVYVRVDGEVIKINVYCIIRLQQDFESEMKEYGFYLMEPNLILVNNANKQEIIFTINKLHKQRFFENLKPDNSIDYRKLIKIQ